ncbi:MAG TPA: hypothetical protein VG934_02355 [Candidatus Paceibacterota bacterium]|nr:hypothetical protein [Candidatus Paceibacterota bacterium]
MINPQLLEYVRAQRAAGLSKEVITQALAAGGWTPGDVTEAFMAIDGVQKPPTPPPPAPAPVAPAPRAVTPPPMGMPMQQPIQPMGQPMSQPMQPMNAAPIGQGMNPMMNRPMSAPMMGQRPASMPAMSEITTVPGVKRRGGWIKWVIILVILLLILAGGAYAFLNFGSILSMVGLGLPQPAVQEEQAPADQNNTIQILPTDNAPSTDTTSASSTASTTLEAQ